MDRTTKEKLQAFFWGGKGDGAAGAKVVDRTVTGNKKDTADKVLESKTSEQGVGQEASLGTW